MFVLMQVVGVGVAVGLGETVGVGTGPALSASNGARAATLSASGVRQSSATMPPASPELGLNDQKAKLMSFSSR